MKHDNQTSSRCLHPVCSGIAAPLAHRGGISLVLGLLIASGGMCADCGHGTRVTSKNWAVCKKCGKRVPRRKMEDVKVTVEDCQNVSDQATARK